jgi:predicted secreted protein
MSNAVNGIGTLFRRWNTSTEEFDIIAEIKSITNERTRETMDVTSFDSTGGYREFIGGLRNAGTVSLDMNFTRAGFELLTEDYESDTLANYEIVLPDDEETTLEFEGLVTKLGLNVAVEDPISSPAEIQMSGSPTLNSGASSGL